MSINIITMSGNLGKDPELKYFDSGSCVTKFSIAGQIYRNKQKETVWLNCEVWGKFAEIVSEFCKKGQSVTVSGEFFMNEWDGQNGKESRPTCIVKNIQLPPKQGQSNSQVYSSDDLVTDVPF